MLLRTDFFLQFDNTNEVMQNLIPKFRQNSIISQKPGCLSENFLTKNFDEL